MGEETPRVIDGAALQARVGKVIKEKWTLTRVIGVGGMAAIYEARHEIGRRDAIKMLHPDVAGDEDVVERLRREARAVNEISHPAVVEVRDVDVSEEGLPFLVMELVEGKSIGSRLRSEGAMPLEEALELGDQLLDVLSVAHEVGVVHRDIKPSNLLVDEEGKLRVLDFGVARIKHAGGKPLTEAGTTLGTVGYMPPEQLMSGDVDARADVYAVGATLFEMLAGRSLHLADSEEELAARILREPAEPLAAVAPEVPAEVCQVVDRALAYRRERRYPDAATMRDDLRAARRGEEPPFASAQLAAGSDPRDMEPPPAPGTADSDAAGPSDAPTEDRAELPAEPEPDTVKMAEQEPAGSTEIDDRATTRARTVVDEQPTLKRGGGTVRMQAPEQEPEPPPREPAQPKPAATLVDTPDETSGPAAYLGWVVAAVAILVVVVVWRTFESDEETLPEPLPTTAPEPAPTQATAAPEPEPAPRPEPEPEPEPEPAPKAQPSPAPRPTATPDAGVPFPIPSGIPTVPTAIPTALPTSLPTGLPTGFPTAPPPSEPPPPTP